jgi:putative flippase GtrA
MRAKACAGKVLPEKRTDLKTAASRQLPQRTEVTTSSGWKNARESGAIASSSPVNPSVDNRMLSLDTIAARSVSRNAFPANGLSGSDGRDDKQKAREKCRRTNGREFFLRWWRFNLVGAIGIVVQLAALFLLKSIFHFNYLAATAVAVEAAVVHNFVWHEQFTWADRIQPAWCTSLPRLARFNLTTGGVSVIGNLALMKVMVGLGHMNYFAGNAMAIALCSVVNFLMSDGWVFERG